MNRCARMAILLLSAAIAFPGPAGAAKKRGGGKSKKITVTRRFSEPAAWELVRLLGTHRGRQWGEPVMLVDVRSVRGGQPVSLVIHNTGWRRQGNDRYQRQKRPTKPEVPPALSSVLKKHKPGDVIAIRAQTINGIPALHSAKAYQAKPGEFEPDSAFFVKAEQQQNSSGQTVTRVTLAKHGKALVLPLMQNHGKDEKGRATHTTRQDLARAVGRLSKGDLVEVDVGADRGRRVIRHIAKWQEPYVGQFIALGETKIDGTKHVTLEIRSPLGSGPLMIRQASSDGVKYTDDYRMARFLKTLKPNQYVAFKTRTQDDKTMVWLIGRTDKTSSKRTADGARVGGKGRPKTGAKRRAKGGRKKPK